MFRQIVGRIIHADSIWKISTYLSLKFVCADSSFARSEPAGLNSILGFRKSISASRKCLASLGTRTQPAYRPWWTNQITFNQRAVFFRSKSNPLIKSFNLFSILWNSVKWFFTSSFLNNAPWKTFFPLFPKFSKKLIRKFDSKYCYVI